MIPFLFFILASAGEGIPTVDYCPTLDPAIYKAGLPIHAGADVCHGRMYLEDEKVEKMLDKYCFFEAKPTFADSGISNAHIRFVAESMDWKKHIKTTYPNFDDGRFISPNLRSDEHVFHSSERLAREVLKFHKENKEKCKNGYVAFTKSRGGLVLYMSQFLRFSHDPSLRREWHEFLQNNLKTSINVAPSLSGSISAVAARNYILGLEDIPRELESHKEDFDMFYLLSFAALGYDVGEALRKLDPALIEKQLRNLRPNGRQISRGKFQVITMSNNKSEKACRSQRYKKLCYSDSVLGSREQIPQAAERDVFHAGHICGMKHTHQIQARGQTITCDLGLTALTLDYSADALKKMDVPGGSNSKQPRSGHW